MRALMMLLIAGTFALGSAARAEDPLTIKTVMQQMGAEFKAIGMQVDDPANHASLAEKAKRIRGLVLAGSTLTPDALATAVPANQLPVARLGYEKLMLVLAAQSVDLEVALRQGDVAKAKEAMRTMSDTKLDGHDQFKP